MAETCRVLFTLTCFVGLSWTFSPDSRRAFFKSPTSNSCVKLIPFLENHAPLLGPSATGRAPRPTCSLSCCNIFPWCWPREGRWAPEVHRRIRNNNISKKKNVYRISLKILFKIYLSKLNLQKLKILMLIFFFLNNWLSTSILFLSRYVCSKLGKKRGGGGSKSCRHLCVWKGSQKW